jgi:peptidoglycan/xylan/chitin deacetylase (PgdA/CDA1 family)
MIIEIRKKHLHFLYRDIIPKIGFFFRNKKEIPIIYYHDIGEGDNLNPISILKSEFERQMQYLSEKRFETYIFSEIPSGFHKSFRNSKEIIITFDDGFSSNYKIAFPILKKMKIKFNVFVSTRYIVRRDPCYLSKRMMEEMIESGIVEFGAHTHTHCDTRSLTADRYQEEFQYVNDFILSCGQKAVQDFCFPYGLYNRGSIERISSLNLYKRLYTSDNRPICYLGNSLIRGRVPITKSDDIKIFENKVNGKYSSLYLYSVMSQIYRKVTSKG